MKKNVKKVFLFLLVAVMLIINATAVFGAWGDPGYTVNADGRWYQWFELDVENNEKISTAKYEAVPKLYTARDAAVQVTSMRYSSYPVAFTVYVYQACAIPDSATAVFTKAEAQAVPYYSNVLANNKCLGYKIYGSSTIGNHVVGLWSPDSYQ